MGEHVSKARDAPRHSAASAARTIDWRRLPAGVSSLAVKRTSPAALLRIQRSAGNRVAARLIQLQRSNGDDAAGKVDDQPTVQPLVRLSVPVEDEMDAREFLIVFAIHYQGNAITTREQAEAGINDGTIYWVNESGEKIPPTNGPHVTKEDVDKTYKLVTVYAAGVTPMSGEAIDDLREQFYGLGDSSQAGINEQTNEIFWDQTGYKVGEKLDPLHDPDDQVMAQDWLRFRAHIVGIRSEYLGQPADIRRQLYEMISPEARAFLFRKGAKGILEPSDFLTALRVASKIADLTEAERAEYLARVTGQTNDWSLFERAVDLYVTEREDRGEAGEEREDAKTELFGADELYSAYHSYIGLRDAAAMAPRASYVLNQKVAQAYSHLKSVMTKHGFEKVSELEAWFDPRVQAFEAAFEKEALFVAREMLDRYLHVLYVERERILVPTNLDIFYGQLKAAGKDLEPLAEAYPLLLDEDLRDDLAGVFTKSRALSTILLHAEQRRADIDDTRNSLQEEPELIYGFDVLRAHAMIAQGVDEGSIYHQIVLRKKNDIEDSALLTSILLAVIAIAAGLLTGGGGAVAVLGAATAAGIGAYEALQEFRRYEVAEAAHGAGLLSDDPSFAWVVVAAVGAGLDLAAVAKAVRVLGPAIHGADGFAATGDLATLTSRYDDIVETTKLTDLAAAKSLQDARASIVKAAMARAQEQQAWRNVLIPAARLNDVLAATGESFARLVYAVYSSISFHGRNLDKFLKTQQARRLLGDLGTNPAAHPEHLDSLRQGFLAALDTQERVVKHANSLGLRDFEIEHWFRAWAGRSHYSADSIIEQMTEYAAPLTASATSKHRYATELMTDQRTREVLQDYDLRIAGRGGISSITARKTSVGERVVTIEGRVIASIGDRAKNAPNFNKTTAESGSLFTAKELGLKSSDWEWAHLWGPGFGDEAAAGLMLAPRSVNQFAQNRGVEGYIRDLAEKARAVGGEVHVRATATSWGNPTPSGWVPPKGVDFLQSADYTITVKLPGEEARAIAVTIDVAQPPATTSTKFVEPADALDLDRYF